jgi:hypothetical protein
MAGSVARMGSMTAIRRTKNEVRIMDTSSTVTCPRQSAKANVGKREGRAGLQAVTNLLQRF